jgi:DNA polymerase elongation subunit (family B)
MEGWIFDLNETEEGIICWIKQASNSIKQIFFNFRPSFYILIKKNINQNLRVLNSHKEVYEAKIVKRKLNVLEESQTVIRVSANSRKKLKEVFEDTKNLLPTPKYFNLHIPTELQFLYSTNLFPTAFVKIDLSDNYFVKSYQLLDSKDKVNYDLPELKIVTLDIKNIDPRKIYRENTPIEEVIIIGDANKMTVLKGTENTILQDLNLYFENFDPDIVVTRGGDDIIFPYLAFRSKINNIPLYFSRIKKSLMILQSKPEAYSTYFSYGKIYNKPLTEYTLEGRLHLDKSNSFLFPSCGLQGLIEVSRMCSIPLQRCSRMTIGQAMSSAQYCEAYNRGVLVPYKSENAEEFKSAYQLLKEDKGGFVFQPRAGLYENVFECDFESMYPNIMVTRNVSPETLAQTPLIGYNKVPGTHFYITPSPKGIVPSSIKKILEKRHRLKKRRAKSIIFDKRQEALKWILVTSFGFLGFHNAKFGSVESHMTVTAYARDILINTANLAFKRGWEIIHGIVDCIWVKANNIQENSIKDFCKEVGDKTQIPLNLEGVYDWIVFLPTKRDPSIGALTRYYGKMKNGKIKVRGIELRRRDPPLIVKKAQSEIINTLSNAKSKKEFIELIPKCRQVVKKYEALIRKGDVDLKDLFMKIHISREISQYNVSTPSLIALKQLKRLGINIQPGQNVKFIYTNSKAKNPMRKITVDVLVENGSKMNYDREKYVELINRAYDNLFEGIKTPPKKNTLFEFINQS